MRKIRLTAIHLSAALCAAILGLAALPAATEAQIFSHRCVPGGIFLGPDFECRLPAPYAPPLSAFHATLAEAGPRTSSGLLVYETPGVLWTCEARNCGGQGHHHYFSMDTCVALSRQAGPVVSLEADGYAFTRHDIAACNDYALGATPTPIPPPGGGRIVIPGQ